MQLKKFDFIEGSFVGLSNLKIILINELIS